MVKSKPKRGLWLDDAAAEHDAAAARTPTIDAANGGSALAATAIRSTATAYHSAASVSADTGAVSTAD